MIVIPNNEKESQKLMDALKQIDITALSSTEIENLIQTFDNTEYDGLRNLIANKISNSRNKAFLPKLIKKLKDCIHTNTVYTLLYCASHYDCSAFIQVFIDFIILKDGMALVDAIGVVKAMNLSNIEIDEAAYAVNKLDAYLLTIDKTNPKYAEVNYVAKFLEDYEDYS